MKKLLFFLILSLLSMLQTIFPQTIRSSANTIHTYQNEYLTGIDFPIGALGGGCIRMDGKAERKWWQIFGNNEERPGSGSVLNSFFAIRTYTRGLTAVRALQTSAVGPFPAMRSLSFQGEYPFGWYTFEDDSLPVNVKLEAYNPLIPMDLKNSAIPCAIFRITVKNTSASNVNISLLGSQQNAVGFNGYDKIGGTNNRSCSGYGANNNSITSDSNSTSLKMIGTNGSMQLSAYETGMTYTASWDSLNSLFTDFSANGSLTGPSDASSPAQGVTVDGAIAKDFTLTPGQEKTVTFVLSWYFPNETFGKSSDPYWYFPQGGEQYQNWWTDASDVDNYVKTNFNKLDSNTRLYHDTFYSSNIPRYILDRISSNLCVLKSPTAFWTKNGYFGLWESTSSDEVWVGNCKHVYQYAQAIAYVFPSLARKLREQDLNTQTNEGLFPSRNGEFLNTLDGHFGTILSIYREHLLTNDNDWLNSVWAKTKEAMDYAINKYDNNHDGMLSGLYYNTLDCPTSGTNPWIGSMYLAALKACAKMAEIEGDTTSMNKYNNIFVTGASNQNSQLWDSTLNYYVERSENLPHSYHIDNGCDIDMFLGQWWANQLGLGQIYPVDRTKIALSQIYTNNRYTDSGSGYFPHFRNFLGAGKTGWEMIKFPGVIPTGHINYYDEVMSGFEYTLAAELIQYDMTEDGITIVNNISKRYDGRFRDSSEVTTGANATVFGTGSPFGEDECGNFYGRPLSSWSVLLALQGFIYDGPNQTIGFKPTWNPDNHASFFTTSSGWGLFTQNRNSSNQTSKIDVKYGHTVIKNIILLTPEDKKANNISVMSDGLKLSISSINQSGNILTINLNKACMLNSGSNLTVSFDK